MGTIEFEFVALQDLSRDSLSLKSLGIVASTLCKTGPTGDGGTKPAHDAFVGEPGPRTDLGAQLAAANFSIVGREQRR